VTPTYPLTIPDMKLVVQLIDAYHAHLLDRDDPPIPAVEAAMQAAKYRLVVLREDLLKTMHGLGVETTT
jgi:hypothetical protein